jgi:hypothetical protein
MSNPKSYKYVRPERAPSRRRGTLWAELRICPEATNTNALNLITLSKIAPHPIPLPTGERGG